MFCTHVYFKLFLGLHVFHAYQCKWPIGLFFSKLIINVYYQFYRPQACKKLNAEILYNFISVKHWKEVILPLILDVRSL